MGLLCMDEHLDERISPVKLIYWPDEATQIPAHWHTNMELNFIASGAMTLLENGRELRMEAGAVHFMNSGVGHRMEAGSRFAYLPSERGAVSQRPKDRG